MIPVHMKPDEQALFERFVNQARRYLEFGAGGSTCLAATQPKEWIVCVDSSRDWLAKVRAATETFPVTPQTMFVDIGPTANWGRPIDVGYRDSWPSYHEDVWSRTPVSAADFCLVDGRFRVACMMQCLLRCAPGTIIAIHDFEKRPQYHVVKQFVRDIETASELSVFVRSDNFDAEAAAIVLDHYRYDPA